MKSFLKWAGGKQKLLDRILPAIGTEGSLIEPFAGSAVVSINAPHRHIISADTNPDLINLFRILVAHPDAMISKLLELFTPENNTPEMYYELRRQFNLTTDLNERAHLFVYLNRHGYNGMCRYNSTGGFNVPFGRYKSPAVPLNELRQFANAAASIDFVVGDFRDVMGRAKHGDVIYCDPPYVPVSATASFTSYSQGGFSEKDHLDLRNLAVIAQHNGVRVVISNHDTPATRKLYSEAQIVTFDVQRNISCDGANRQKAKELIAVYAP